MIFPKITVEVSMRFSKKNPEDNLLFMGPYMHQDSLNHQQENKLLDKTLLPRNCIAWENV